MKHFFTLTSLIVILICIAPTEAHSQENSVKINLLGLPFRNVIIQGERKLTDNLSVQLGVNVLLKGKIPFTSSLTTSTNVNSGGETGSVGVNLDQMKLSGFGLTPELKFYTGGDALSGFYLSGWGKYSTFKLSGAQFEASTPTQDETVDLTSKMQIIGGGIGIGTHWIIKDVFSIDVLWLGLGYGTAKISFEADFSNDYTDLELEDLKADYESELSDIEHTFKSIELIAEGNSLTAIAKRGVPMIRFGLSLGYSF